MSKTILIISSEHTGHGHKSITEALNEHFSSIPDIKVYVIDGFALAGRIGLRMGRMYGSMTRIMKDIWRLVYDFSDKNPELVNELLASKITHNFLKVINMYKPDLILSLHPNFNGSVLNILERYNITTPFVTLIADLVSISTLWMDERASFVLCPTIESRCKCMEYGLSENKLIVTGFPIRQGFAEHIQGDIKPYDNTINKPLRFLLMSGGEGVGNMGTYAKILLENFNCEVKIIAGRNNLLKKRLNNTFINYGNKVKIYGFVKNMQELILDSDIAITRGSPNAMLEAVCCNVPLIITGALPGQEEGNPYYMIKYNLGVICNHSRLLKDTVNDLLYNDAERLNKIKESQRAYINENAAKNTVDFIIEQIKIEKTKRRLAN